MSSLPIYPDWWNKDVDAHRDFYKTAVNARESLKESIKQFSDNSVAFDARGKGAVATLFVISGAAGYIALQAIPQLFEPGKQLVAASLLLLAGTILLMNRLWVNCGSGLLHAYYAFYVASVVDSAKKHFAWGVANHQWHRYVLKQLARNPKSEEELIDFWMEGSDTLYRQYTRWLSWVARASVVLGLVCFGVAGLGFWRGM